MRLFVLVLGLIVAALPALAAPKAKVKIAYYPVTGATARAIVASMRANTPQGGHSLAAIRVEPMSAKIVYRQKKRCVILTNRAVLHMTLIYPRHNNPKSLRRRLRRQWRSFLRYARVHEARHKAIYLHCARRYERRARALPPVRFCRDHMARMKRIFDFEWARCARDNAAYDRKQARAISRLPLLVAARRRAAARR